MGMFLFWHRHITEGIRRDRTTRLTGVQKNILKTFSGNASVLLFATSAWAAAAPLYQIQQSRMFFKCAVFYLIFYDGITGSVLFNNICVVLQKESWQKCFWLFTRVEVLQSQNFSQKEWQREREAGRQTPRERQKKRERERERKKGKLFTKNTLEKLQPSHYLEQSLLISLGKNFGE